MATINYPSFLPKPLQQGYSARQSPAFIESQPAVGGYYTQKLTDDIWQEYTLRWTMSDGQAVYFWQWFRQELKYGSLPFNIELKVNGEMIPQEVKFRSDGIPQLTSESGVWQDYSAKVIARSITTSYDDEESYATLKWFAERSPDGNPFTGMSILDKAITKTAPEA